VRPPYPVEIPPLLPAFLNKRRSKVAYPLRKSEELGIDRPSLVWTVNLSYRGDKGGAAEPGDLDSAYSTIRERWLPMAAAARGAGLVEERGGRWHVTGKGRAIADELHREARAHYETLRPVAPEDLAELARLLDKAFNAAARAPEPSRRMHTPFAFAYRRDEPAPGSFAQLDAAIYGLWQVRDDCHMAAWRAAGISGPDLEVLTRVWRGEAADEDALAELLPHITKDDIRASVARLRERGYIAPNHLETTTEGARMRQQIEDETDRLFFAPWPDDVGAKGRWIASTLAAVNAALT
jgi:helix-turn-helix protein